MLSASKTRTPVQGPWARSRICFARVWTLIKACKFLAGRGNFILHLRSKFTGLHEALVTLGQICCAYLGPAQRRDFWSAASALVYAWRCFKATLNKAASYFVIPAQAGTSLPRSMVGSVLGRHSRAGGNLPESRIFSRFTPCGNNGLHLTSASLSVAVGGQTARKVHATPSIGANWTQLVTHTAN